MQADSERLSMWSRQLEERIAYTFFFFLFLFFPPFSFLLSRLLESGHIDHATQGDSRNEQDIEQTKTQPEVEITLQFWQEITECGCHLQVSN
jgi:hypothetical protein